MTTRRWLILFIAVNGVAGLCLTLAGRPATPPAPGVVPFEMIVSNHMVVQTKINGKGPYSLIFDLGAPITLLTSKTAEAAGVIDEKAPRSFLFSMRGEANIESLEIGNLKARDLPVIVLDHPVLKALSTALKRPLDGIIGYTFFAHYKTTIDYQKREMTFEPVDFEVKNLVKDLPERIAGPRVAKERVLDPAGLWGLAVTPPPEVESGRGMRIETVLPGSPAATAGLKAGDLLTSVDGRWTTSVTDTYAAAASTQPGRTVNVTLERDGKELSVLMTPAAGF